MGASREATFSALAEPALLLGLATICVPIRALSLSGAFRAWTVGGQNLGYPATLAAAITLFIVLLAECSRIPFDDPTTHLELTMVHEVMVLDHGGPDLAFIVYGSALKLFILGSVIVHLFLPISVGANPVGATFLLLVGQSVLAVAVGLVESVTARLRLSRVPEILIGATVITALGLVALFYRGGP
jgi:formate hydrogenlyase subunit 4